MRPKIRKSHGSKGIGRFARSDRDRTGGQADLNNPRQRQSVADYATDGGVMGSVRDIWYMVVTPTAKKVQAA